MASLLPVTGDRRVTRRSRAAIAVYVWLRMLDIINGVHAYMDMHVPKQRMRRAFARHITYQLKVASGLGVDHHRTLSLKVSDAKRCCGETSVQLDFRVFE